MRVRIHTPRPVKAEGNEDLQVLYIEDNRVNALVLEAIAARLPGLQLRVATTGAEALAAAQDHPPDLLLVDRHLPDMDGDELLARLHRHPRLRRVPAVMVSADCSDASKAAALAVGFCDYWTKPLNAAQVRAGLEAFRPLPARSV
jgi:CheY-like chemotaxis protein